MSEPRSTMPVEDSGEDDLTRQRLEKSLRPEMDDLVSHDPSWAQPISNTAPEHKLAPEWPETWEKPVRVTDLVLGVTDLDDALAAPMPPQDSPVSELVSVAGSWHKLVMAYGRKTAVLACRIGHVLLAIHEQTPHGQWMALFKGEYKDVLPKYETAKRYIRLAKKNPDPKQLATKTLVQAYEDAEILNRCETDRYTAWDGTEDFGCGDYAHPLGW